MTTNDSPVALVTGAGSGIGRETARLLADEDHRVVLVARTIADLEATAERCDSETLVLPADLTDPEAAARIVDDTLEAFGRLDTIINNAGVAPLLPIDRTDPETIRRCYALNAVAPAITIARAWATMLAQSETCGPKGAPGVGGRIVNTSTIGTDDPFPGFFAYAASKAPVNLMAKSCHQEGHLQGVQRICAFAVAPGAVETPMLRSIFDAAAIPSERCLSAEDVAKVIVDCAVGRRDEDSGTVIWLPSP